MQWPSLALELVRDEEVRRRWSARNIDSFHWLQMSGVVLTTKRMKARRRAPAPVATPTRYWLDSAGESVEEGESPVAARSLAVLLVHSQHVELRTLNARP